MEIPEEELDKLAEAFLEAAMIFYRRDRCGDESKTGDLGEEPVLPDQT